MTIVQEAILFFTLGVFTAVVLGFMVEQRRR